MNHVATLPVTMPAISLPAAAVYSSTGATKQLVTALLTLVPGITGR